MGLFSKKKKAESLSFDPEKEYPVLRCSICNGEQVGARGIQAALQHHGDCERILRDQYTTDVFPLL